MLKILDLVEAFFSRYVPSGLKRPYAVAFRYSVFVFGGLIGYIIYFATQKMLFNLGIWRGIALAVGLILAIIFTFTYHRYITFDQKSNWKEKLVKFIPIQATIATINWISSLIAIERMHFPDLQATFVITFVLSMLNFGVSKLMVFHKSDEGKSL